MQILTTAIKRVLKDAGLPQVPFVVEHPRDESHGDYSTNVALLVAKEVGEKPRELADQLVVLLQKDAQVDRLIDKIEVAGAGFINFWLQEDWLIAEARKASQEGYGSNDRLKGKKIMVEYTDPNPFKEFHIGHLMSNTVGEALTRLIEAQGAEVRRANYQGDVGLHVAKSVWGMQQHMLTEKLSLTDLQGLSLKARQEFMGRAYAYGATQYEESALAKAEMDTMNKVIYDASDKTIDKLYRAGRSWSLEYFEAIYSRLGTKFNEYFFESEAGEAGLRVIEEGLKRKVLEIGDDGAVVFRGEKYGLHTRVFRNKLGLPTYEGKELGLAGTKYERYPYELSYIVTANEIDEYFKVLIKALTLLAPELGKKTMHLSHGIMKLSSGKMSSRTGKIVTGEGLLDELKEVVVAKMGERNIVNKDTVADHIAVAALKWTVLKQALGGDIVYEPERMTNLEGDTGPYVQYTYARARSVLQKSEIRNQKNEANKKSEISDFEIRASDLKTEELSLLRWLYRYPETVVAAGQEYAPHYLAHYLYQLAGRFNSFYAKHEIAGHEGRLLLTRAVANILKSGLHLLGIVAPEEM